MKSGRTTLTTLVAISAIVVPLWYWFILEWQPDWLHAPLVGSAFIVAGFAMWWRRPDVRSGALSVLIGFLFVIPTLRFTYAPALWTLGSIFDSLFAPVVVYLTLAFPSGELRSHIDRIVVAVSALVALVPATLVTIFFDPAVLGCAGLGDAVGAASPCGPGTNLILIASRPELLPGLVSVANWSILAASAVYSARLIWRYLEATVPARRILAPLVIPAMAWATAHAISRIIRLILPSPRAEENMILLSQIVLAAIPFGALVGLLRTRARKARIGELIVELGSAPTERLRDAVARTLGDPDVEVGHRTDVSVPYRDLDGNELRLPAPDSGRVVTRSGSADGPSVVIVHDGALVDEPDLLEAVVAAATLAIENERLQREVRAQLAEVEASRVRIVESGDAVRRRIERDLHDGAQQRLVNLSLQLELLEDDARTSVPEVADLAGKARAEATAALVEIRNLAQGVHPSVLVDEGLLAAVEFVAERCPIPVEIQVSEDRYEPAVEATAYFVVSEGLTNVIKHADASRAEVVVERSGDVLHVEVRDDGVGGADIAKGSGLGGLADRASALGGSLKVAPAGERGTRLSVVLPCG